MAMIKCPNCEKEISDKALKCPACGYEMPVNTATNRCEECGQELPEGATECPNCGCPVKAVDNTPQRVSVANVELHRISKKTRNIIIAVLALIVIGVGAVIGFGKLQSSNKASVYKENLAKAVSKMYSGGYMAESACTLIHDVWYNTIYEKSNWQTDKYTKIGSTFHEDFNTSLMLLTWDDDFSSQITSVKNNVTEVENLMKELQLPPEDMKAAHTGLLNLYDSYIEITNLAINPSGNLNSYTSSFNSADSNFAKYYKAMQIYVK